MMVEKYCDENSVFELNLPSHMMPYIIHLQVLVASANESTTVDDDVLQKLQAHCEVDLKDVFSRFQRSPNGQKIELQKQIIKEENELMQRTGMMV